MIDRPGFTICQQVLLADISDITGIAIFGEQMIERLFAVRTHFSGDRIVPLFAVGKDRIDIEHYAPKIEHPVAHNIADAKARAVFPRGVDVLARLG